MNREKLSKKGFVDHKQSIGVVCIRFVNNKPEVLMVCKRYTYAYAEFIHGKYPQGDFRKNTRAKNEIISLFNGMTIEEKLDILSLDFEKMWYRIWLKGPRPGFFFIAKNKFESTFLMDDGCRLSALIGKSTNSQRVWEMPKGRKKSPTEPDVLCAIREFTEETNIPKKDYRIIPNLRRKYSYIDKDIKYTNTYYVAVANGNISLSIDFSAQDQVNEIGDIRWMNIEAIRCHDFYGHLEPFIKPIFKVIKKERRICV